MITIEQEVIRTASQTFRFGTCYIINTRDRGLIAEIMFEIVDENNKVIGTKVVSRTGEAFNDFWNNFNNGRYLFELLIEQEQLGVTLSDTIEKEFVNE